MLSMYMLRFPVVDIKLLLFTAKRMCSRGLCSHSIRQWCVENKFLFYLKIFRFQMKCRVLRTYLSGACVRQVNVWPQSALFNIRFRVYSRSVRAKTKNRANNAHRYLMGIYYTVGCATETRININVYGMSLVYKMILVVLNIYLGQFK